MAMSSFAGNFTANATTGNQSVTGVGFQPKVVIFFGNKVKSSDTPPIGESWYYFGVGISSSDRRVVYGASDSAANCANGHDNTKCIYIFSGTSSLRLAADLVSLDSDGFTVNITTASVGENYKVGFLALGGTDLTNVKSGQLQLSTSTGNQSITGAGFQPDTVIAFTGRSTTSAPPGSTTGNARFSIGAATSSSARWMFDYHNQGGTPTKDKTYQRTDKFYSILADDGGSVLMEADFVSMDSDGFTFNISTATTARYVHYLLLKGGQFKIGTFNQATSTGDQVVTGIGFQPTGTFFLSAGKATTSSISADMNYTIGAASSSSARVVVWGAGKDADTTGTLKNDQTYSASKVIYNYDPGSGTTTLNAVSDFVSHDSNGFTVNWSTADAIAREILYMTFGSTGGITPTHFLGSQGAGT